VIAAPIPLAAPVTRTARVLLLVMSLVMPTSGQMARGPGTAVAGPRYSSSRSRAGNAVRCWGTTPGRATIRV
jgi:hypothetical protein